jgi:hypothetical protein
MNAKKWLINFIAGAKKALNRFYLRQPLKTKSVIKQLKKFA